MQWAWPAALAGLQPSPAEATRNVSAGFNGNQTRPFLSTSGRRNWQPPVGAIRIVALPAPGSQAPAPDSLERWLPCPTSLCTWLERLHSPSSSALSTFACSGDHSCPPQAPPAPTWAAGGPCPGEADGGARLDSEKAALVIPSEWEASTHQAKRRKHRAWAAESPRDAGCCLHGSRASQPHVPAAGVQLTKARNMGHGPNLARRWGCPHAPQG